MSHRRMENTLAAKKTLRTAQRARLECTAVHELPLRTQNGRYGYPCPALLPCHLCLLNEVYHINSIVMSFYQIHMCYNYCIHDYNMDYLWYSSIFAMFVFQSWLLSDFPLKHLFHSPPIWGEVREFNYESITMQYPMDLKKKHLECFSWSYAPFKIRVGADLATGNMFGKT